MEKKLKFKTPGVYLFSAPPKSGKSHFIRYLFYTWMEEFDHGLVISPVAHLTGDYYYVPENKIHTEWDKDVIKTFMNLPGRKFLIIDDGIGVASFKSKAFSQLVSTYRWRKCTIIISVQYMNNVVPPIIRNCYDWFLFARQDQELANKAIYNNFCSRLFNNYLEFKKYFEGKLLKNMFCAVSRESEEQSLVTLYPIVKAPGVIPKFQYIF